MAASTRENQETIEGIVEALRLMADLCESGELSPAPHDFRDYARRIKDAERRMRENIWKIKQLAIGCRAPASNATFRNQKDRQKCIQSLCEINTIIEWQFPTLNREFWGKKPSVKK